ncbi:TrgA family protein [Primorskyibacter sp. S187A]|uniref:TrgA family protein n=1 Tax=Primorskyibacter sp. S187A TaxID=3415130 RepID=UPI003C7D6ED8
MPTAAKLVASICLAALAFIVSQQVMAVMPDSTAFGNFLPLNIVLGVLVGWLWLGRQVGEGVSSAISYGLTSAAVLTAVALFLQSANEMMRLAMRNRYDGPFEAVAAIFVEGLNFAQYLTSEIVVTLAIGGAVSGILADWAARRWS